jgi:hypothetical protein
MAHTGLSKRVVVTAIAALRRKQASNADKVFETTDADAGPTAIAHGWTLEELWRDGGAWCVAIVTQSEARFPQ